MSFRPGVGMGMEQMSGCCVGGRCEDATVGPLAVRGIPTEMNSDEFNLGSGSS